MEVRVPELDAFKELEFSFLWVCFTYVNYLLVYIRKYRKE